MSSVMSWKVYSRLIPMTFQIFGHSWKKDQAQRIPSEFFLEAEPRWSNGWNALGGSGEQIAVEGR